MKKFFIKQYLFLIILAGCLIPTQYMHAQENRETEEALNCKTFSWNILGQENVITNKPYQFSIVGARVNPATSGTVENNETETYEITEGSINELLGKDARVSYSIYKNNQRISNSEDPILIYSFPENQSYVIDATISHPDCTYDITKQIQVHNTIHTILTEKKDIIPQNISNNTIQHGHYIESINTPEDIKKEEVEKIIQKEKRTLQDSTTLFITQKKINELLPVLEEKKTELFGTGGIALVIVTNQNKQITEKILTPLLRTITFTRTYLVSEQELQNLAIGLSIGQDIDEEKLGQFRWNFESRIQFSLNYVINYLIYQGLPFELISIMMTLVLAVACIVIRKQVIGRNAFGVFFPLLFAINLHLLGARTSIGLLIVGACAVVLVQRIIQKINLLYSAKIGLTISLYVLFTLLLLRAVHNIFGEPSSFQTFSQPMFIIAYASQLLVSHRLFKRRQRKSFKSRETLLYFAALTSILYFIFHSQFLQDWMITHPLALLAIIALIGAVGRYTGLQMTELVRFWPLITQHFKGKNK